MTRATVASVTRPGFEPYKIRMSFRTVCPFCNAVIVEHVIPAARTLCPRCAESFSATEWEPTSESRSDESGPIRSETRRGLILSSLIALALVGAALVWFRPWGEPPPPRPMQRTAATIPPAALSGLHYLPATANVIIALQPAALLAMTPENEREQPNRMFERLGVPESVLATLARAGIEPQDIEQIIAGLTLAPAFPRLTLVVKLRRPADREKLLTAMQAERKPVAGRAVYTTKLSLLLFMPIDDVTMLFGLSDEDFARADPPNAGIGHWPEAIRESLTQSLDPSSLAWIVTADRDWSKDLQPLISPERLRNFRSLTAGAFYDNGPRLRIHLLMADAATAEQIRAALDAKLPAGRTLTVDGARVSATAPMSLGDSGSLLKSLWESLPK